MICLEGPDGSGKTTHARLLEQCLNYNNIPGLYTREPGGTEVGELLRKIVFSGSLGSLGDILLYTLNRHIHIQETILPNQNKGNIIILDRYLLSTLVYQGNNEELIEKILFLHKNFNNNLFPKLTLILNIDPETAFIRVQNRNKNKPDSYYDSLSLEFYKNISECYIKSSSLYKGKIKFINANLNIEEIHKNIVNSFNNEFNLNIKALPEYYINKLI